MQHPLMELCLVLQAKEVHIHELSINFQNFAVLFSCKAFGSLNWFNLADVSVNFWECLQHFQSAFSWVAAHLCKCWQTSSFVHIPKFSCHFTFFLMYIIISKEKHSFSMQNVKMMLLPINAIKIIIFITFCEKLSFVALYYQGSFKDNLFKTRH